MTNKTVLVTGGAGYIGSHVCKALSEQGFTPIAYDSLCSGNREAVKWGAFEEGDIRDRARLSDVIQRHQPVAIMHFAALIQVGESVADPAKYYDNNVFGSYCLLEEARAHGIGAMVFSSTAAVYGTPQTSPIAEDHPKNPINPYGHTKLAMENMIRDYAAAYPLKFAILRYFNAAGADPTAQSGTAYKADTHIIPLLMQVASDLMPEIKVFGEDYPTSDGSAVRDYIHVTDLAEAHILALRHIMGEGDSLVLNLGTNNGHSVKQTVEVARATTGHKIPAIICARRAGDPAILVADATRARTVLNWSPRYSDLGTIVSTAWQWRSKQNKFGKVEAFLDHTSDAQKGAA